jgi:hypothetical protein
VRRVRVRRVQVRLAAVAVGALVAVLTLVASAEASRGANAGQRAALTTAVHASRVAGLNQIPDSEYRVVGQRVSTVSENWASARLVATPAFRSSFQNAIVIAVRPAGTEQWTVVDLGSADVGCGIAPNKVLADLFDTKTPCPSGGIG